MAAVIPEYVLHVTPLANTQSILTYGIDPRRRYPFRVGTRSFFVEQSQLMWALAHMSARHNVSVGYLGVFRFNTHPEKRVQAFKKIGFLPGIYYTDMTGVIAQYEVVRGDKVTAWYESAGGDIHPEMWQLIEDGGLG